MKLPRYFAFLSLLLLASVNAAQDKNFDIYLCFGQSNIESGGKMEEMDRTVDKRFQVMLKPAHFPSWSAEQALDFNVHPCQP